MPSLFKTAKYQRFNYEPRYYDPVREDLDERESRIRGELNLSPKNTRKYYGGQNIKGAFQKSRTAKSDGSALLRFVIIGALSDVVYYFWSGNVTALYILVAIPLVYIAFRYLKSRN